MVYVLYNMERPHLTDNEKVVVLSLMRNPEHSDTEISGSIGMNLFTFNKIKNSLTRRGLFLKHYVPNYARIGFEILVVTHGSGMAEMIDKRFDEKVREKLFEILPTHSIFRLMGSNQGMSYHVIPDFTTLKQGWKLKGDLVGSYERDLEEMKNAVFSLKNVQIKRFFDVQSLIEMSMNEEVEVPFLQPQSSAQDAASIPWSVFFEWDRDLECFPLDDMDMKVLIEIVKDPYSKGSGIIASLGLSRYKFNNIKEKLFKNGFIKPFFAADIMAMGYDVLMFTHLRFSPGLDPMKVFREYHDVLPSNLLTIIFDGIEGLVMGVYHDLSEGSEEQTLMRNALMEMNILDREPDVRVFSLPNCKSDLPLSLHRPLEDRIRWKDLPAVISELRRIIP